MRKNSRQLNYDYVLDLHGKSLDMALFELEKVIFSREHKSIMIIHGHGEGILRNGIRKFLKECTYAKDIMYGEDMNVPGGSGVTIVYL
jgi:dsDNA-specific endonuclease/ATPase MutS2